MRLGDQLVEPGLVDPAHRLRERPHAREDHAVRGLNPGAIGGDLSLRPDPLQRLLDRAKVPHPVVEDRDPGHSVSVPLVDGTPLSPGSMETASRRARANALKLASIMWWAFEPERTQRCSGHLRGVGDRPEELLGQLRVEARDRHVGKLRVEGAERPARDVDRALTQRLVHRHQRRAEAADPGAVTQRLVDRLPEADPDVLGGVVGTGLQVPGRLRARGRDARDGRAAPACDRGSRRRSRSSPRRRPGRGAG